MSATVKKIALIGLGRMGKNHLRVLEENANFEVVAVFDPQFQSGSTVGRLSIPAVSALNELSQFDFDCAIIAAPTVNHLELAEHFLSRGTSVLVEKPVCSNAMESRKLIELSLRSEGRVYVGHVERFNPAVLKAEDLLKSGELGTPVHFAFTRVGGKPIGGVDGTNVLIDLAIHDLDILRVLAGEVSVVAGICHSTWKRDIYDTSEILLVGEKGCSASIHSNWISPTKIRSLRITATAGVCDIDYMLQTCVLYSGNASSAAGGDSIKFTDLVEAYQNTRRTEFRIPRVEPLANQLNALYQALNGGDSRICSLKDAVRSVELAEHALTVSRKNDCC